MTKVTEYEKTQNEWGKEKEELMTKIKATEEELMAKVKAAEKELNDVKAMRDKTQRSYDAVVKALQTIRETE